MVAVRNDFPTFTRHYGMDGVVMCAQRVSDFFLSLLRRFDDVDLAYRRAIFFPIRAADVSSRGVCAHRVRVLEPVQRSFSMLKTTPHASRCRPATFEELLCFADTYPHRQLQQPIVASGSAASIGRSYHVPCICGSTDNERCLTVVPVEQACSYASLIATEVD